jgi:hypothetical protein
MGIILGEIAINGDLQMEDAAKIELLLGEYALLDARLRALQVLDKQGLAEWKELEDAHMEPSEEVAINEDVTSVVPLHEDGKLYNEAEIILLGKKVEKNYLIVNYERRSMDVTVFTKYGKFELEEILGRHGCYTSSAYPTYLRFGILEELVIELLQILRKYY